MTDRRPNSRMGQVLPDVAPVAVPLVAAMLETTDRFGAGAMHVAAFQSSILALLRAEPPGAVLAPWIRRALEERQDQVLARRTHADRDETIQIIYVAPGAVHPCHCHHNVTSTQLVLTGSLRAREYDRVAQAGPDAVALRLLFDGRLMPGDVLQATDLSRNAHWFAAEQQPATLLNFNIRGYENDTFWPLATRPLGRRLLDATGPAVDGLLHARILLPVEAYARFGSTPLDAFPVPPPPARTVPHTPGAHAPGAHAPGSHAPGSHALGSHALGSHTPGAHAPGSHTPGSHAL